MAAVLDCFDAAEGQHPATLSALHARFSLRLKRFFRSYRLNAADVEDLVQDVFVRLAGPAGETNLLKPEAFVFTLARNLVRDRARRLHTKAQANSIAIDEIDLSCERPGPDQSLELAQLVQQVEQALESLSPNTRRFFLLHRLHGISYTEIAMHMKVSVSMVEKHIMSAITALRSVDTFPYQSQRMTPSLVLFDRDALANFENAKLKRRS
jgi:RNA polymerase sigma factor (sigma-70 family)